MYWWGKIKIFTYIYTNLCSYEYRFTAKDPWGYLWRKNDWTLYRVSKGGHGISDEVIEKRYVESLLNLNNVIKICDEVNIYDNTNEFIQLINIKNGKLICRDKIIPEWANTILKKL